MSVNLNEIKIETVEQLESIFNLFISSPDPSTKVILNDFLTNLMNDSSIIPLAFQILQTSKNENSCFYAALCFHDFFLNHYEVFTEENIIQLSDLFQAFILNNNDRLAAPDTTYAIISLADLCIINLELMILTLDKFPPEVFLAFFCLLQEEKEQHNIKFLKYEEKYKKFNDFFENQLPGIIYNYLDNTPFSFTWANALLHVFSSHQKTCNIIKYFDYIVQMTQNQDMHSLFLKIFSVALNLDFGEDQPTEQFNTQIIPIAVDFSIANPQYAIVIWELIFQYSGLFYFRDTQMQLTWQLNNIFFSNIDDFCEESELFMQLLVQYSQFITIDDFSYTIPDDFRSQSITKLLGYLISKISQGFFFPKFQDFIHLIVNNLNNYKDDIHTCINYLMSLQPSVGFYAIINSKILNELDEKLQVNILENLFLTPEIPKTGLFFIDMLTFGNVIDPYIEKIVQICLNSLSPSDNEAPLLINKLSKLKTDKMVKYADELYTSIFPHLSQLTFTSQKFIIIAFFNLFVAKNDCTNLVEISNYIIHTCSRAVQSDDIVYFKSFMHFIISLFGDYNQMVGVALDEYMKELFSALFQHLSPLLLIPQIEIQEGIASFVCKGIEKKLVVNFDIIGQWIQEMLKVYPVYYHIYILSLVPIPPSDIILQFILHLTINDNAQILTEVFRYLNVIYDTIPEVSVHFWEVFLPQFLFSFIYSSQADVVSSILDLLGKVTSSNNQIKYEFIKILVANASNFSWLSNTTLYNDYIKTIIITINQDKEVFEAYSQLMNEAYPIHTDKIDNFYRSIMEKSRSSVNSIKNFQYMVISNQLKDHLRANNIETSTFRLG